MIRLYWKELLDLKPYKIVMTGSLYPQALAALEEQCEIKKWEGPGPIPREQLLDWLQDADGLVSTGNVKVDGELLAAAPQLRVIAQSSVGYDNVDIQACTAKGVPFGNTPGVLVETVADLTYALLLAAARRIHDGWEMVKSGRWTPGAAVPFGVDPYGKTLGIVGMGDIGSAVARRAQASGMNVIYHNRSRREDDQALGTRYVQFDELLAESDFIVVLVPLSASSKGMFDRDQFAKMKPSAYFINASRGSIVNTEALYEALRTGGIAYAALDVTDPEPLPVDHPLIALPNVLITPHVGSATHETRGRMSDLTAANLLAGLAGKPMPACVNSSAQRI
ncbi:2-hydroxyacid dehydrogenase [Paenibacillus contaminans]|uniref:2-hydroxyacid dehydrogenase n=1 Tax=Paenibacillus contaminans TaxID=450362 RepID=UPI001EDF3788|nr:D-glycerate dehydrogenase [Paenibacillus contaminans]